MRDTLWEKLEIIKGDLMTDVNMCCYPNSVLQSTIGGKYSDTITTANTCINHSYLDDKYNGIQYLDNSLQWIDTGINSNNLDMREYSLSICLDELQKQVDDYYFNKLKESEKMTTEIKIKDIEIIRKNKVVKVTFDDDTFEKMICHEEDIFDLRTCLFISIAKHLYKNEYTWEGIEYKAKDISYQKKYIKMVDKALKAYNKKLVDEAKEKWKEEDKKRAIANKKAKHAEYLKRRKQKRLDEQAKAICEGLKMYDAQQNK